MPNDMADSWREGNKNEAVVFLLVQRSRHLCKTGLKRWKERDQDSEKIHRWFESGEDCMTCFFDMTAPGSIHGVEKPEWDEKYLFDASGNRDMEKFRIRTDILTALREGTRKVLPEEVPQLFVVEKPKPKWWDFFQVSNGIKIVREPMRELLERLDPGVHQFFPVAMRTKRRVVIEGTWFVIVITARQDSVVSGYRGKFIASQLDDGRYLLNSMVKHGQVPIDATRLSGLHLWREEKVVDGIFASDELIAELKAKGLKTFPAVRAEKLSAND